MHPTIEEQLAGIRRLLTVASEATPLAPTSADAIENARRLLTRVERSWSALLPFYLADNAALRELLGGPSTDVETNTASDSAAPEDDVAAQARWNSMLREELSAAIRDLRRDETDGVLRRRIHTYLVARVEKDPS